MKRILKITSKIGVATMILTSFFYTLKSDTAAGLILFIIGYSCASYYFIFMDE